MATANGENSNSEVNNSIDIKEEDEQIERALESISNYTKCIRNFIGLSSENIDENSDTESALEIADQVSVNKDFNTRHNSDVSSIQSRLTGKFGSIPEGCILDEPMNHRNSNLEVLNTAEAMHQINQDKTDKNECPESNKNVSDSDDAEENVAEETRSPMANVQKKSVEAVVHRENEPNSCSDFNIKPKSSSESKFNNDREYFYEMEEIQCGKNSTGDLAKKNTTDPQKTIIPVDDMDPDTVCGLGVFRPQWLQKFATAKIYLIFYSIIGILQGSYFTYLIGTMSTIEKRYAFKSKISGTIMMLDEITPLFLGILVGYFGGRAHRPRIVAFGMFMSCVCCLISALPYFMYGTSQQLIASHVKNDTSTEYCDRELKYEQCSTDDRPPTFTAVACLLIGSFFKGFGNLAYYAVGMSYMDDNAKKKNTPIYFAVVSALRMLGPVLGFLMSSAFLKYYENPLSNPGYGPEDPRWIGAWWLGFVLQGVLLFIFTIPILFFPRRLPKQRLRAFSNTKYFDIQTNAERVKGLVVALKRVLKNPLYIYFTFGTIFSIIAGYGYYTMLPKYLEIQFRVSASEASILTGPPCITASQIMTILGGILIYKVRPKAKTLVFCHILTEVNWLIGCFVLMWPSCGNFIMTGTTLSSDGLQLQNECNSDCLCSTSAFNPVCGPDGMSNYFSPCHAGCVSNDSLNLDVIGNCSCVHNSLGKFISSDSVVRGLCEVENCWSKAVTYIIILTILSAISGSFRVAHTMILLRSIEPQDKSLALGLFETLLCGLAFVPLPVIFGALADASCLIWETSCGEVGNCWVYDLERFNYLLHGTSAGFTVLAMVCYILVIFQTKRVKDLYEDDECEFNENTGSSPNAGK